MEVLFFNVNVKKMMEKYDHYIGYMGMGMETVTKYCAPYGVKISLQGKERKKAGVGKAGGWKEVEVMGYEKI